MVVGAGTTEHLALNGVTYGKIPWTEESGRLQSMGSPKVD